MINIDASTIRTHAIPPPNDITYLEQTLALLPAHATEIDEQIIQAYSPHPKRHYHHASHIATMLRIVAPLQNELLVWVVLFHDLVYNTARKDNEQLSAEALQKALNPYYPPQLIQTMMRWIQATANHIPLDDSPEQAILLDADLAILAAPPETYLQYTQAIRSEYSQYPSPLYRIGRAKVLRTFLERPAIYFTLENKHLEPFARKNLQTELKQLSWW
jgi:predicted metal-dependent HD superfamily phosphohydrolase